MAMKYIDEVTITHKRILLRVDYNVSLDKRHHIANDERIKQSIPTIQLLLKGNNQIIILSHLGRPRKKENEFSLKVIQPRLEQFLPGVKVSFVEDLEHLPIENTRNGITKEVILLENIRFFKGEDTNDESFIKQLAQHGDVYINDAFSASHRKVASIVGLPTILPCYAGLLMKKELLALSKALVNPKKPVVAILGGAKISTKIQLITKLIDLSDFVLLGGGLANTFLLALKTEVGKSLVEQSSVNQAKKLIEYAKTKRTKLILPSDVIVGSPEGKHSQLKLIHMLSPHDRIYDIGPETQAIFAQAILQAKTIIWNGPVGLFEIDPYRRGTDFIYYAITANSEAFSIVGGGETLAALSQKEHLEKISHISTGGGAMLEFIENGTLPGIEALIASKSL